MAVAGLLVAAVPAGAMAVADDAAPRLVVRLYDAAGVPAEQLITARIVARAILEAAGLRVIWHDCQTIAQAGGPSQLCHGPLGSTDVLIRIVTAGRAQVAAARGSSALDAPAVRAALRPFDRLEAVRNPVEERHTQGRSKHSQETSAEARARETTPTTDFALGFSSIDVHQNAGWLGTVLADRVAAMAARAPADAGTLLGRVIAHEIGHLLLGTASHSRSGLMRARWTDDELRQDRALDWRLSPADARQLQRALHARSQHAT
jgi:hypothetical protein